MGSFSPSVLLRVARRTGALDRPGLAVREEPVPSSPAQFRALADGTLEAALTSPDNVVAYRFLADNPLGGPRDVRIVAAVDRGLGLALYARPGRGVRRRSARRHHRRRRRRRPASPSPCSRSSPGPVWPGAAVELVELGSTPKRLRALLDGRCAATMLNAGNDLRADDAGLVRLADVTSVAAPYLGTVLAVQGEPTPEVRRLAEALRVTTAAVLSGAARDVALAEAEATGLPPHLAVRYVDGLADPDHGLVPDGVADLASLEAVVSLRRAHTTDALDTATSPVGGLVDAAVA